MLPNNKTTLSLCWLGGSWTFLWSYTWLHPIVLHLGDATWSYTAVTHLVHGQLCSLYKVSSQPGIPLLTSHISFHTTSYGRKINALLSCEGLLDTCTSSRGHCAVQGQGRTCNYPSLFNCLLLPISISCISLLWVS